MIIETSLTIDEDTADEIVELMYETFADAESEPSVSDIPVVDFERISP